MSTGRPQMATAVYAPEVHMVLYFMERERMSVAQASQQVGKYRSWTYRRIVASRCGDAPGWIAEEWDRIRGANRRCDLCSDPIAHGVDLRVREDGMAFDFCGQDCMTAWTDAEEM